MKIDREKNTAFKVLNELVGNEDTAEKLLNIANYRRTHNIKELEFINITNDLDKIVNNDIKNTLRKPRQMSQATKDKNYAKALAKLNAKYGK